VSHLRNSDAAETQAELQSRWFYFRRPNATVSKWVAQFIARQKPFMADFNVPKTEFQFLEMPA
jgi:hypothetical protein